MFAVCEDAYVLHTFSLTLYLHYSCSLHSLKYLVKKVNALLRVSCFYVSHILLVPFTHTTLVLKFSNNIY
jgi:hypothetical protein